ncbi:MAG: hypothetical protein RRY64_10900, partial [Oscillospiraceae bacterium]
LYVWKYPWLKLAGTLGLLCAAITYHAIFNLMVSAGGALQMIGYLFPIVTVCVGLLVRRLTGLRNAPLQ